MNFAIVVVVIVVVVDVVAVVVDVVLYVYDVVVVVVDVVVVVVDVVVVVAAKVNLSFKKRSKFLSSSRFELRTSPKFLSPSFYRQALVELTYL